LDNVLSYGHFFDQHLPEHDVGRQIPTAYENRSYPLCFPQKLLTLVHKYAF